MAKFDIRSKDRSGITQEILSIINCQKWDLISVEMYLHHTYVNIRNHEATCARISSVLREVDGLTAVTEVSHFPSEVRSFELTALLTNLPNPIIQLDHNRLLTGLNAPAQKMLGFDLKTLKRRPLKHVLGVIPDNKLNKLQHMKIQFRDRGYLAKIIPLQAKQDDLEKAGSIIILSPLEEIGKQLSIIQEKSSDIIGSSLEIKNTLTQLSLISEVNLPVLITGETGTGKELFARECHRLSQRRDGPFLSINCAAIPEQLLESELFGYAPGAFTGAQHNGKTGLFELAEGGTIFLDEIGEMSMQLQAKLLRFLQDYTYRRVGAVKEKKADVRIISATHQELESNIENKQFRSDLYYRINVLNLKIPPLRQRLGDVKILAEYFLIKASEQMNKQCPKLGKQALYILENSNWPGNVRQLESAMFRAVLVNENKSELNETSLFEIKNEGRLDVSANSNLPESLKEAQLDFEKRLIERLWPEFPSTRKLAKRLKVSHNKIATMIREQK